MILTCACKCGRPVKPGNSYIRGHARRGRCMDGGPDYEVTETGCWEWRGSKFMTGYGLRRRNGKAILAHRLYYEEYVGPIPEGLELDHLCSNPGCVNPDHLEPVTHAENTRRGARAKLNAEQAAEIRDAQGTYREIASRFGVSETTIGTIKRGIAWSS